MAAIRLIPVLELPQPTSPEGSAALAALPFPARSDVAAWQRYPFQVQRIGGYSPVPPIEPGCALYWARSIPDDDLRLIVERHLAYDGTPVDQDAIIPLCGGCALIVDDRVAIIPQCCDSLPSFLTWKEITQTVASEAVVHLGDGHPSPVARLLHDIVYVDCKDDHDWFRPPADPQTILLRSQLVAAIRACEIEMEALSDRIDAIALEYSYSNLTELLLWTLDRPSYSRRGPRKGRPGPVTPD